MFMQKGKRLTVTHSLRHLAALQLQSEGIELKTISDVLGHKSGKSVLSYISS